jgi:hypothetical protein
MSHAVSQVLNLLQIASQGTGVVNVHDEDIAMN